MASERPEREPDPEDHGNEDQGLDEGDEIWIEPSFRPEDWAYRRLGAALILICFLAALALIVGALYFLK